MADRINVKEIVRQYLNKNGFDGLCEEYSQCACEKPDLMSCEEGGLPSCEPGYKITCADVKEGCDYGDECRFHITTEKPKGEKDDN